MSGSRACTRGSDSRRDVLDGNWIILNLETFIFGFHGQFFGTDTNFQLNLITLKFWWCGAWVWSRDTFSDLGTMIFGFPVKFYLLLPIFGPIQQLFIFRGGVSGCGRGVNFHGLGPSFSDSSANFCYWCRFPVQSDNIEI